MVGHEILNRTTKKTINCITLKTIGVVLSMVYRKDN